jgi:hypothetical protein
VIGRVIIGALGVAEALGEREIGDVEPSFVAWLNVGVLNRKQTILRP